jgi:hypothetical protein
MSDKTQFSPSKKAALEAHALHQRSEFDEAVAALFEARRSRKGHKTALTRATKAAKWFAGRNAEIAVGAQAPLGDVSIDPAAGEMVEEILRSFGLDTDGLDLSTYGTCARQILGYSQKP